MCQRIRCPKCGRPGWVGCGAHVEQVLKGVPREERCQCREQARAGSKPGARRAGSSWLERLLQK